MSRFMVVVAVACMAAAAAAAQPSLRQSGLRKITVDAATTVGTLRSLQGVNGHPAPADTSPRTSVRRLEHADERRRLRRLPPGGHRSGAHPRRLWTRRYRCEVRNGAGARRRADLRQARRADPLPESRTRTPKTRRATASDRPTSSSRPSSKPGPAVLFRLGRSEGADPTPPADFDRYAAIAKHIVLHYNRGWANGFHYGIRYWEVWNEPDLGKVFWSGSEQQYFELYRRSRAPSRKRTRTRSWAGRRSPDPTTTRPIATSSCARCAPTHTPLDFYSWHWYATDSNDPLDFTRIAQDMRTRLDGYGLTATKSFLTEWNYGLSDPPPSPLVRASFITSALIYMQDAPIDAATLYRADNVFGADGATPDKTGQALIALGQMKDTPDACRSRAPTDGFAVEAGRSEDGGMLRVLISNYQIPAQFLGRRKGDDVLHVPHVFDVRLLSRRDIDYHDNAGFDLTIEHLPPDRSYVLERCRITDQDNFQLVSTVIVPGQPLHLRENLPPPGVELVTVREVAAGEKPAPPQPRHSAAHHDAVTFLGAWSRASQARP